MVDVAEQPAVTAPSGCWSCTSRWRSSGLPRRPPRTCSSPGWSRAPRTWRPGTRRWRSARAAALRDDDYVFATTGGTTTRWPGCASPEACLAELMSKATGLNKAKGGSMHPEPPRGTNMLGSYAIVGAHLPMAVGRRVVGDPAGYRSGGGGLLRRRRDEHRRLPRGAEPGRRVAAAGAVRMRNNLYMEYTPIGAVTAVANPAADRAPAYNIPAELVDGNDVLAVHAAVAGRRGPGARRRRNRPSSRRARTGTTGTAAPTRRKSTGRPTRSRSGWPGTP